jgi:hypothetical protein
MPKKPTGTEGFARVTAENVEFHRIHWPADKSKIEATILRLFDSKLPTSQRARLGVGNISQNAAESDLDGTIQTRNGDRLIDLVEIAPLADHQGRYENAKAMTSVGELADAMLTVIRQKSAKYAGIKPRPWLLTYTTHWAFRFSDTVLKVVGVELCKSRHNLERVYHIAPVDEVFAEVKQILPVPLEFMRLDTTALRKKWLLNFDPAKGVHLSG